MKKILIFFLIISIGIPATTHAHPGPLPTDAMLGACAVVCIGAISAAGAIAYYGYNKVKCRIFHPARRCKVCHPDNDSNAMEEKTFDQLNDFSHVTLAPNTNIVTCIGTENKVVVHALPACMKTIAIAVKNGNLNINQDSKSSKCQRSKIEIMSKKPIVSLQTENNLGKM